MLNFYLIRNSINYLIHLELVATQKLKSTPVAIATTDVTIGTNRLPAKNPKMVVV